MSDTMSWLWIAVALVLPFGLAVIVAWPFWGRSRDSLGSGVGSLLILALTVVFVGREYIHLQQFTEACIAAEMTCRFHPEPFTRFGIYAFIAMAQIGALFAVSAAVEHRIENASFAKEWQR